MFSIKAALPFPLRLEGEFEPAVRGGQVRLKFETRRHDQLDERVAGGGHFDFEVDRAGWLSYSFVTAEIEAKTESPQSIFLEALNAVIENLRDQMGVYWIRTVEFQDLFAIQEWDTRTNQGTLPGIGGGRSGGFTFPVAGLTAETVAELEGRLRVGQRMARWRAMELDAVDAYESGRYEDAVILIWTAVETAVKTHLPRLAQDQSLSVAELATKLEIGRRLPPLSYEEASEQADVHTSLRVLTELLPGPLNSDWICEAARSVARLRNETVHLGVRVAPFRAQEAIQSISFAFRHMRLQPVEVPRQFNAQSWATHFHQFDNVLLTALRAQQDRVVLYNPEKYAPTLSRPFSVTMYEDRVAVHIPRTLNEANASSLLLAHLRMQRLGRRIPVPNMRVSPGLNVGMRRTFAGMARAYNAGVFHTFVMAQESERKRFTEASDYFIRSLVPELNNDSELANGLEDVNLESTATRIAPYFVFASEASKNFFRSDLRPRYAALRTAVAEVATILAQINSGRAHSICEALQILQARTWFGCTIIHCPLERVSYWPGKVDSIKKSWDDPDRDAGWRMALGDPDNFVLPNSGDTDTTEQSDAGNGN